MNSTCPRNRLSAPYVAAAVVMGSLPDSEISHRYNSRLVPLKIKFHDVALFNPLKPSVIRWLHFKCSVPSRSNLPFSISDIRALWRSVISARVPECQKLKTVS